MRRVVVVGSSGAGKSRLAGRLADLLGVEHVELDAIHHGPDWEPLPAGEMQSVLDRRCPVDGAWVADGNYSDKGGRLIRRRADTIVWIDFPRSLVMRQLLWRTVRRGLVRQELWNGNRESLRNAFSTDPERSVLLWSFTHHASQRVRYDVEADERWVRLSSRGDVRRYLDNAAILGADRSSSL